MKLPAGGHPRAPGPTTARTGEEIRCPSCSRLLVLRSGPAITAHFAHRPRQSCRNRPGRPAGTPLRLEQLTLFELDALPAPGIPTWLDPFEVPALFESAFGARPGGAGDEPERITHNLCGQTAPARPRRRRRAWLPRLIRWIRARTG